MKELYTHVITCIGFSGRSFMSVYERNYSFSLNKHLKKG